MKKVIGMICLLTMFGGTVAAEAGTNEFVKIMQRRGDLQGEVEGKELWRRMLGKERCLLLYIDESNELQISFTDGLWMYMTEELVERVKAAGRELWEKEKEVEE